MSEKIDEWNEVKEKLQYFEESASFTGLTGASVSTKALRLIMKKLEWPVIHIFIEKEKGFKLVNYPCVPRLGEVLNCSQGLLKVVDVSHSIEEGYIQVDTVDVTEEEHQKIIEEENSCEDIDDLVRFNGCIR